MVYCVAYDCLMIVGRPKAFHPTNFKQTTNEGCKPTKDLRAKDHSKPHRTKLRSDAVPTISFCVLMKIEVRLRQKSKVSCLQGYFLLHRS